MREEERKIDPRAVDSVMRAIGLVETSLGREIGLSEMAEAACYSPFYFSRLFARATGHAPYDYLMRRRTAVAAERVTGGAESLTDIALDSGFSTPDGFARAFRRCFGATPSEARKTGEYPRSIARTGITRRYVEEALARPFAPPEAELPNQRTFIEAIESRTERGALFEITKRGGGLESLGTFSCVLNEADAVLPFPAVSTILPAGRYARFTLTESEERLAYALEFAYRAWLPSSGSTAPPHFDLVERKIGKPIALSLYLGPAID